MSGIWIPRRPHGPRGGDRYFLSSAAVTVDSAAPVAITATLFRNSTPWSGWLAGQRLDTLAAMEALGGRGRDAAILAEATGQTAASLDKMAPIEVLALAGVDARAPMDALAATGSLIVHASMHLVWAAQLRAAGAPLIDLIASLGADSHVLVELLATARKDHVGPAEMLAPAGINAGVRTEWLGRAITVIDAFGSLEATGSLSGDNAINYDAMTLTALAADYLLPLEIGNETPALVQPIPQISGSRIRLLPADGDNVRPFDPIAPGEIDTFGFDLSIEVGQAEIVGTTWTCRMLPYQPGNGYADTISAPGPYILGNSTANMVQGPAPLPGQSRLTLTGKFALAEIGGFPVTAAGSWFAINMTVALRDGRRLRSAAAVLCSLNGRT